MQHWFSLSSLLQPSLPLFQFLFRFLSHTLPLPFCLILSLSLSITYANFISHWSSSYPLTCTKYFRLQKILDFYNNCQCEIWLKFFYYVILIPHLTQGLRNTLFFQLLQNALVRIGISAGEVILCNLILNRIEQNRVE